MSNQGPNPGPSPHHQVSSIKNQTSCLCCPIRLFLRDSLSSWQEFALYNCKAPSTNRPFMRKTKPIPKTPEPTQPLLPQRVTSKTCPNPTWENKPNQTQSRDTQDATRDTKQTRSRRGEASREAGFPPRCACLGGGETRSSLRTGVSEYP